MIMKKHKKIRAVLISIISVIMVFVIALVLLGIFGKGCFTFPVAKKDVFEKEKNAQYASALTVKDNKIYSQNGQQFIFKGLMVPDSARLYNDKNFNEKYFDKVFKTGVNTIRIPVHPDRWIHDKYYLWRYLDKIVGWSVKNNKYVIIDLHFIGNVLTGSGDQMVDVGKKPYQFSIKFWTDIADYFKDVPNVIYEIYNEPAMISAGDWGRYATTLVDTIRKTGSEQLILVSGIDYSYDLSYWVDNPVKDSNVAYTAHIYPNRNGWAEYFSKISDTLPVVVTEWGYISEREIAKQLFLIGTRNNFGEPMIKFMKEKQIGWIACWYDDSWEPPMFFHNTDKKTDWGNFISGKLK